MRGYRREDTGDSIQDTRERKTRGYRRQETAAGDRRQDIGQRIKGVDTGEDTGERKQDTGDRREDTV